MAFMDEYYRAYRDFQDKVSPLKDHKERMDALQQADLGVDMHNGSASVRMIDLEWVEAIEKALPALDAVIRENRRFIRTDEEVVPIERSRRITTESVRHLAQHTNMIARVDGDEVTPESILNIRHEESFAIYENRFIVLLIDTAIQFIEKRYQALTNATESTLSHLCMNREFSTDTEHTRFSLDYFSEFNDRREFDVTADVSSMSEFERVQRLRTFLSAFAATPLIRSLKGVEPVRPPITRTNLLRKNPNYRACLDLWVFLESYTKLGYETVQNETRGQMDENMKKELESAMDMVQFIVRSRSTPRVAEVLSENYEKEKELEAAEAERLEQEKNRRIELRIAHASEDERLRQEAIRAQLVEAHEKQLVEMRKQKLAELEEQKQAYEQQLSDQQSAHEAAVQTLRTEHESAMQAEQERFAQAAREHEAAVQSLRAEHESAMQAEQERFAQAAREHEAQKAELTAAHAAAMDAEKQKYEKTVASFEEERRQTAASHASRLQSVQDECRREVEALEQKHTKEKQELDTYHRTLLADKEHAWDDARAVLNDSIRAEREHVEALKNKGSALQQEIAALQRQLDQEKKRSEQYKRDSEKAAARTEEKLARAEANYNARLERQEKRWQRKNAALERKLRKALAKCPVSEVLAEDEEEADITAE